MADERKYSVTNASTGENLNAFFLHRARKCAALLAQASGYDAEI